jgi:hypothetical protein
LPIFFENKIESGLRFMDCTRLSYTLSENEMDTDYATWVQVEMSRVPNNPIHIPSYAKHIVGIMKNLPRESMFRDLFVWWCLLMITRSKVDFDLRFTLLNMASDLLHLPAAMPLLEDTTFRGYLDATLSDVATRKKRNEELAKEIVTEFDLSVSNYMESKRRFITTIQEELIATALHPDRIGRLVKEHGQTILRCI